jgi:hypothetical protein
MARTRTTPNQLALDVPLPQADPPPAEPYYENRGPRDWQPVQVVCRYGNTSGLADPVFPLVVTKPLAPRNVQIRREDGHKRVVPVRNLRRRRPT